jgi:hypothetical protein
MRKLFASFIVILVLTVIAGCSGSGITPPGNQGPVIPGPGGNPGGNSYQLQCFINLSRDLGNAPMPCNMWATVIGGKAPYYFRWNVNGDEWWDYGGYGVTEVGVNYGSAGIYDIKLEVEDSNGAFYQATARVDVRPSGPSALPYAFPSVGPAPLAANLDGSGSYDRDGYIVKYEWDFTSDGIWDYETDTNGVASEEYPQPGTYNATLRVTDDDGLTDTASVQIIAL